MVDAGNSLGGDVGHIAEARDRAKLLMRYYKEMNYRCVAVGRKDLGLSIDFLKIFGRRYCLKLISSNIYSGTKRLFNPYEIVKVNDVRIAFIGITDDSGNSYQKTARYEIRNPRDELLKVVGEVEKISDVIVVLTDLDQTRFMQLIKGTSSVDMVILSGTGPILTNPIKAGGSYLLSTLPKGKGVGLAEVAVGKDGSILRLHNTLYYLYAHLPADKGVKADIEALKKKYQVLSSSSNPFLKALEEAKKRKFIHLKERGENSTQRVVPSTPNPFIELLKKATSPKEVPQK